jgi:hypothetical protein
MRVQPDRQPLLGRLMKDPRAWRDDAITDADRQLLDRPEDRFLAGGDLDPIHERVL